MPNLRRAGSSSDDLSYFGEDSDVWFSTNRPGICSTLSSLVQGISADFCQNGLPWEGTQCRSVIAGLSGILYVLPALVSRGHIYDQVMWPIQACFSVLADYIYICQDSVWHGIDRYFAIFNVLAITIRASIYLRWHVVLLVFLPVSCYVAANRAKSRMDLCAWHRWHCLWHVVGGPLACLVMYMIHNCSSDNKDLENWCA